ncbi:MAG: MOSC domain-containing protein [Alphaproteobacteria bacterium]
MPSTASVGAIKSLWRYPVKSMRGEGLDEALVTDSGVLGDRAYALIDQSNGKVASAKLPKKWGGLVEFAATFVEPPRAGAPPPAVRISWPSGSDALSGDEDVDRRLSESLGRPVALTTSRPETVSVERLDPMDPGEAIVDIGAIMLEGRFMDYAALHLVTTATLARLSALSAETRFDERRFRPNLVIETPGDEGGFVENDWVGRTLTIGNDVRLRVTDPTPRCAIPTLAQGGLDRDPGVLRTIAQHNMLPVPVLDGQVMPCAGIYAFVVQGGTVRKGDPIRVE